MLSDHWWHSREELIAAIAPFTTPEDARDRCYRHLKVGEPGTVDVQRMMKNGLDEILRDILYGLKPRGLIAEGPNLRRRYRLP